ncbi:hypothetical protein cand_007760 [Cryptosporidium andersoni]|uniref:Uncharacterized protein n=1 Tax=Cryptosporidium andersoni TaxID=117008 RepID=A0A1J4MPA4_9CRYT|nr:hypothetical protein cand_007760 [Cryptosporidium andersoni]
MISCLKLFCLYLLELVIYSLYINCLDTQDSNVDYYLTLPSEYHSLVFGIVKDDIEEEILKNRLVSKQIVGEDMSKEIERGDLHSLVCKRGDLVFYKKNGNFTLKYLDISKLKILGLSNSDIEDYDLLLMLEAEKCIISRSTEKKSHVKIRFIKTINTQKKQWGYTEINCICMFSTISNIDKSTFVLECPSLINKDHYNMNYSQVDKEAHLPPTSIFKEFPEYHNKCNEMNSIPIVELGGPKTSIVNGKILNFNPISVPIREDYRLNRRLSNISTANQVNSYNSINNELLIGSNSEITHSFPLNNIEDIQNTSSISWDTENKYFGEIDKPIEKTFNEENRTDKALINDILKHRCTTTESNEVVQVMWSIITLLIDYANNKCQLEIDNV